MTLMTASQLFTTDRMDWKKPHLTWIAQKFYRSYKSQ